MGHKIGFSLNDEFDKIKSGKNKKDNVRNHNVGNSDYSKHKIQPWDIWIEYKLNPFDADIVKRVLREKKKFRHPKKRQQMKNLQDRIFSLKIKFRFNMNF